MSLSRERRREREEEEEDNDAMGEEDAGDATEQIVAIAYSFGTLRNRSEKCTREK